MNSSIPVDFWIGRLIGDRNRYRLEKLVGSGGMGMVFLAKDTLLGKQMALKLLKDKLSEPFRKRFEREVNVCAALDSEHIVGIDDYGLTEEGYPFFVMEFLNGETLGQRLERERRLSARESISIIGQVCAGLKIAHQGVSLWRQGQATEPIKIIHRDLKPDNIFLVPTALGDLAKILDFGIAKVCEAQQAENTGLTGIDTFIGTFNYASPEQVRGESDLDERADIYSLGVILYIMLSGVDPFGFARETRKISGIDWAVAHTGRPPEPLSAQPGCGHLPPELEVVVMKCLSKLASDRFTSVDELSLALQSCIGKLISATDTFGDAPALASLNSFNSLSSQPGVPKPSTVVDPPDLNAQAPPRQFTIVDQPLLERQVEQKQVEQNGTSPISEESASKGTGQFEQPSESLPQGTIVDLPVLKEEQLQADNDSTAGSASSAGTGQQNVLSDPFALRAEHLEIQENPGSSPSYLADGGMADLPQGTIVDLPILGGESGQGQAVRSTADATSHLSESQLLPETMVNPQHLNGHRHQARIESNPGTVLESPSLGGQSVSQPAGSSQPGHRGDTGATVIVSPPGNGGGNPPLTRSQSGRTHGQPTGAGAPVGQTAVPSQPVTGKKPPLVLIGTSVALVLAAATAGYGLFRWQADQSKNAEATKQLNEIISLQSQSKFDDCIAKAGIFPTDTASTGNAKLLLNQCRLSKAKQDAGSGKLSAAIAGASVIPTDDPSYQEAKKLVDQWSTQVLKSATDDYEKLGKLDDAIDQLKQIPDASPLSETAEGKIKLWQTDTDNNTKHIQTAKTALNEARWQDAITAARQMKASTPYWKNQQSPLISRAQGELNRIEQARQDAIAAQRRRAAPAPQYQPAAPAPRYEPAPAPRYEPAPAPRQSSGGGGADNSIDVCAGEGVLCPN
jgi:serine/threonine protein kinase